MLEVPVTKEITEYEPKLIGPFTTRQTICLFFAIPISFMIIQHLQPILGWDLAAVVLFFPAGICYLIGWFKPYGMKIEKFLQDVFVKRFLAPTHRKYKTQNTHARVLADAEASWKEAERANMKRSDLRKLIRAENKAMKQQKHYKLDSSAVK